MKYQYALTMRSSTAEARHLEFASDSHCVDGFLCLMGALCTRTLNTRLGSCIKALPYWSSVMHSRIKKLSFTVFRDDSVLVSCEKEKKIKC